MSADKYTKHQKSKYKRYVMTTRDGKTFQGNTEEETRELVSKYRAKQVNPPSANQSQSSKPKFDPDTGERIN